MAVKFVISMVFAILVAIFALQNSSNVDINFLFAKFSISQALVILISAIIGAIIVMILATITQIKQNMKIKASSRTIMALEEENKLLSDRILALTKDQGAAIEEVIKPEPPAKDSEAQNLPLHL